MKLVDLFAPLVSIKMNVWDVKKDIILKCILEAILIEIVMNVMPHVQTDVLMQIHVWNLVVQIINI